MKHAIDSAHCPCTDSLIAFPTRKVKELQGGVGSSVHGGNALHMWRKRIIYGISLVILHGFASEDVVDDSLVGLLKEVVLPQEDLDSTLLGIRNQKNPNQTFGGNFVDRKVWRKFWQCGVKK